MGGVTMGMSHWVQKTLGHEYLSLEVALRLHKATSNDFEVEPSPNDLYRSATSRPEGSTEHPRTPSG